MEEINKEEENKVTNIQDSSFWDEVEWDQIKYNTISREDFLKIKAKNRKIFATFLGPKESPSFYMFKPLKWGVYRDIRSKGLDKESVNDYVLNACMLWPVMDPIQINDEDAGMVHTLIYQIMSVSSFLNDPKASLNLLYEVSA